MKISKLLSTLLLLLSWVAVKAQENDIEMATALRSNGKIYVVVATLAILLIGLFIFLFVIDKKVNRLMKEKTNGDKNEQNQKGGVTLTSENAPTN
jgi:hypothetical protein